VEWYLPILIFFARIGDVAIGTMRVILIMRGMKLMAATLGFFEVIIWIFAVSAVISNISQSLVTVLAYGAGFAAGTLVGMLIEETVALGDQMIRIVNVDASRPIVPFLRKRRLTVTQVAATGASGEAELCFLVVPRKKVKLTVQAIHRYAPGVFITIEDVRTSVGASVVFREESSRLPLWRRLIKFR